MRSWRSMDHPAIVCAPIDVAQRTVQNNPRTHTAYVFDIPRIGVPKKSGQCNTTTMPSEIFFTEPTRQAAPLENMGEVFANSPHEPRCYRSVCRMRGENPSSLHL